MELISCLGCCFSKQLRKLEDTDFVLKDSETGLENLMEIINGEATLRFTINSTEYKNISKFNKDYYAVITKYGYANLLHRQTGMFIDEKGWKDSEIIYFDEKYFKIRNIKTNSYRLAMLENGYEVSIPCFSEIIKISEENMLFVKFIAEGNNWHFLDYNTPSKEFFDNLFYTQNIAKTYLNLTDYRVLSKGYILIENDHKDCFIVNKSNGCIVKALLNTTIDSDVSGNDNLIILNIHSADMYTLFNKTSLKCSPLFNNFSVINDKYVFSFINFIEKIGTIITADTFEYVDPTLIISHKDILCFEENSIAFISNEQLYTLN